jgi:uncharacterized membrane protein YeaQ/YmgE (transglycosylase-associated protein family)
MSAQSYIRNQRPRLPAGARNASNDMAVITARNAGEKNMNFLIWLIVGGVIGWIASLIMRTDGQQGIILNIVVGIVGAFIGGLLISPLLGAGSINNSGLSVGTFLVSLGGAVILLAIVNLFRRGRAR